MSVHLHPWLAVIWLAVTLAEWLLCWTLLMRVWNRRVVFLYFFSLAAKDLTLLVCSMFDFVKTYYVIFWAGGFMVHALALTVIGVCCREKIEALRWREFLPKTMYGNALAMLVALIPTVAVIWWYRFGNPPHPMFSIEQAIDLWVVGVAVVGLAWCVECGSFEDGVMQGICILYGSGVVFYSLRAWIPSTCVALYPFDLIAQAVVVGVWWRAVER